MSQDFQQKDREFEAPVISFLFQCNLFRSVSSGAALCMVCKKKGVTRYVKGKTTSNYHLHMKRTHSEEYEQYLAIKQSGVPKVLIPFDEEPQSDDEYDSQFPRSSPLFEHGFFEISMCLENKIIKANCMICQRMGRSNLVQARQGSPSNLLAHLKRMHIAEYERYLSLKTVLQQPPSLALHAESDIQQSVESTIKSEDLEFVEVNQEDIPGETWDSFDSSEFYEQTDHPQEYPESAATSTTKNAKLTYENPTDDPMFDSGACNDTVGVSSIDEANEWNDSSRKPMPLLFRGGFFRFLKRDGVSVRAECLNCKHGNVYSGHMWSSSNFFKHLSRMHPKDYERFLIMKEEEKLSITQDYQSQHKPNFQQSDFNRIVLTFMISGMHDPNIVEDPSFETLLNDIAAKRTASEPSRRDYHVISPQVLMAEISEQLSTHKEQLLAKLKDVPSISMAIDVWSVNHKTFMLTVVNWVNSVDFNRVSDVLCCDVYPDSISNESLVERFQRACCYYEISKKIVATNNLHTGRSKQIDEVTFRQLDGIDNHIKNSTHLFEMIGSEDAMNALSDKAYEVLHKTTFGKFEALRDVMESGHLSEKPESILDGVFNQPQIGSKVTETYNSVSNLVNCDCETLNEICTELGILTFDENDMNFLREYAVILEPIATAIEYLQKNQCCYATLLPMVHSMKDNLMDVQSQGKIQLCQSLLTVILSGVERHFHHLFDFNNEQCIPALVATCTHPFFKMRWLKSNMKTPINTNQILDLLVRVAKEYDDGTKQESEEQHIARSNAPNPPEKKFKFRFDTTSNEEASDETMIQMDFMSFLKKPCQNDESHLDELKQHPWVQKLFIRYNSIVSSAAALERLIPLQDLIEKSQSGLFSDDLFCKLALLRTKQP